MAEAFNRGPQGRTARVRAWRVALVSLCIASGGVLYSVRQGVEVQAVFTRGAAAILLIYLFRHVLRRTAQPGSQAAQGHTSLRRLLTPFRRRRQQSGGGVVVGIPEIDRLHQQLQIGAESPEYFRDLLITMNVPAELQEDITARSDKRARVPTSEIAALVKALEDRQ